MYCPATAPNRVDQSLILSRFAALVRSHRGPELGLDYEHRLAKLLMLARGHGYLVVISSLVGNVRDFQPDVSQELRQDPVRFAAYERAQRQEELGRWQAAADVYRRLAAGGSSGPGVLHRQARCLLALGQVSAARELFWRAIDQGSTERPTSAQD